MAARQPADYAIVNQTRTAKRAQARANRVCANPDCGKPIDALRSTKRFCSDLWRVHAYRLAALSTATDDPR